LDGLEIGHVLAINRYGQLIKDPEYDKNAEQARNKSNDKAKLKELNFEVTKDADGKANIKFEKKPDDNSGVLAPGMIKLPDERVGLLMIFRVFDRISYALIMQATEPVNTKDTVQTP
jgi:hypothetical protein